jgi:hypothetical protein
VVTIRHWWPPPHVVTALSPCNDEQRTVSSILPSSTSMPHHHSTLPLSADEAMSVPAASVRRSDPTLHPRAPPSRSGAHRPHHWCPQLLLRALVARSPPLSFLREITDNRPFRPSPGSVPASASTTPPRSTSAPISTLAPPASPAPHRWSPTLTAITIMSQATVSPLPIQPPNRFPLGSGKDIGPTFPGSPPSADRNRSARLRLWLPLFWPWAEKAEWAEPVS